jgi:two-component system sensor histidine kinase KdpD
MPTELEFLLDSFFAQISIAVEREYLNTIAKETIVSRETEKLYRTLFDSVSHELKTPITTIKGVIDAFQNPTYLLNKELTSSFVDEAKIAVSRLSRLVENLLDMTRLESQNLHLKIESYTISDIISAILDTVENEMQGHVIRVEFEDENQFIKCDFALIEQALLNIIRNAIEYSPAPGEIIIKTRSLERGALISIADSGKGFPPAAIPQLFRKFFRVPGTKPGGTGLGLSIAKGFIEAHKGTVSAQNRAEGGAEFVIFLPQKK